MLSGLMIIKDGLTLGYPFVEAITQVVKYVDEFVIIECGSKDKTPAYLKKLARKYNNIRIIKHSFDFSGSNGEAIGAIQNIGIEYCDGDYILLVQADEIWEKESIKYASELPTKYPLVGLFNFNFNHIVGNMQLKQQNYECAIRLFKNDERISSVGDGWTMQGLVPSLRIELDKPIFHCGSLGWRNSYSKIVHHYNLYKNNLLYKNNAQTYKLRLDNNAPEEIYIRKTSPYINEIPDIIKPLLGIEQYYVREHLC